MRSDPDEGPSGLNARRDAYVQGMRALCGELSAALSGEDHDGILGRSAPLLEAQQDRLRRLADVYLERPGGGSTCRG